MPISTVQVSPDRASSLAQADADFPDFPVLGPQCVRVSGPSASFLWSRCAQQSDMPSAELALVLGLLTMVFAGESRVSATYAQLAAATHRSQRSLAYAAAYLEAHGFIRRQPGRSHQPTVYFLTLPVELMEQLVETANFQADRAALARLLAGVASEQEIPETTASAPQVRYAPVPQTEHVEERPAPVQASQVRYAPVPQTEHVEERPAPAFALRPDPVPDPAVELQPARTSGTATAPSSTPAGEDERQAQFAQMIGLSVTPLGQAVGPPRWPGLSADESSWVNEVFFATQRILKMDGLAKDAENLPFIWCELETKKRACEQILGMVSRSGGLERLAAALGRERWDDAGPGALVEKLTAAWQAAGEPTGKPSGPPPSRAPVRTSTGTGGVMVGEALADAMVGLLRTAAPGGGQ